MNQIVAQGREIACAGKRRQKTAQSGAIEQAAVREPCRTGLAGNALHPASPSVKIAGFMGLSPSGCARIRLLNCCPSGEIGRHSGLKIRRLPEKGRTGSIPVSGTSKAFGGSAY
jgi:hypothetical protein